MRVRNAVLLLIPLVGALIAAAEEPPLRGTLCFVSNEKLVDCASTTGTKLRTEPKEAARAFVWTSDDGKRAAAGTLAAKAEAIDLNEKEWHNVTLHVIGDRGRGWPLDTRFALDRTWFWIEPGRLMTKLATLSLPAGKHALKISAEHHAEASRSFDLRTQAVINAGEVRLIALPLVTGTIITTSEGKDVPVAGAFISSANGVLLTKSDDTGAFRYELRAPRPDAVVVSREGFASRLLKLEKNDGDKNLGTIRLSRGATLKVSVTRPPDLDTRRLTVTLLQLSETFSEPVTLATRELPVHESELSFENVGQGRYYVLISGSEPLERLAQEVTVGSAEPASVSMEIRPYTLNAHVQFGSEPMTDGNVYVTPRTRAWRAIRTLDGRGSFGGIAWQRGSFSGIVEAPAVLGSAILVDSPALDSDPAEWTITIPKRLITGRVIDAATSQPLPKAEITLRGTLASSVTMMLGIDLDGDGHFQILAAQPGEYQINVSLEGYMHAVRSITVADNDPSRDIEIALVHGSTQSLDLSWPNGSAVANAQILEGRIGNGLFNQRTQSDATGHVTLLGTPGSVQTVYVLPVEGSIAVVHVTIGSDDSKPVQAVVPLPVGGLHVVGVDADGAPAVAGYVVRWNGELLDPDVMMSRNRPGPASNERIIAPMPAGVYELWPVTSVGEAYQIVAAGGGSTPPARVDLASGEVEIRVVVARKRP